MVLSSILSSLTEEILTHVMLMTTSREVWVALELMFASKSRARVVQTLMQLANLKKRDQTTSEYFRQMKNLADTMAAIGMPLREDETISYILAGLGSDYDPLVTSLATRSENLSLDDVYAYLISFEHRYELNKSELQLQINSSSNFVGWNQGCGGGNQGGRGRTQGRGGRSF